MCREQGNTLRVLKLRKGILENVWFGEVEGGGDKAAKYVSINDLLIRNGLTALTNTLWA